MIASILAFSVRARWLIVLLTASIAGIGAWQLSILPIDAVPDITNKQVQINTAAAALGPVEMEKRVDRDSPVRIAGVESTRSLSRNGFSQVTVIFKESADLISCASRWRNAWVRSNPGLPENAQPQMGPISTGLGEIYMYTVDIRPPQRQGCAHRRRQTRLAKRRQLLDRQRRAPGR